MPSEVDTLIGIFQDIVQTEVEPDGLAYETKGISAQQIRENDSYGGVRVKMVAWLSKAKFPVQIYIGSGDIVTPGPETVTFPVMLELPAPTIRVYPIYTVVAEKIEAAAKLQKTNSRMKDFYDLWYLFNRFEFDGGTFKQALESTFARRGTPLPVFPEPFSESLANDSIKQSQWQAFLRRNSLAGVPLGFRDVVLGIQKRISEISHWQ